MAKGGGKRRSASGAEPPRIGAHMSVAGGLARAVDRADVHGCEALQVFTKNASQWRAKPLEPEQVAQFRRRLDETGIAPVVSHASYLINLASANAPLRAQSIDAFGDELDRAEALGLKGVVLHPGACTGDTTEDAGLERIAAALAELLAARKSGRTLALLEHTAGQGRTLGYRFEQLRTLIERLDGHPRVGVCLDTCHLLASGYDLTTRAGYDDTFDAFDRIVGLDRLVVVHVNDSKKPCGSRVDRHEHIGQGCIGLEPFGWLVNDPRFAGLPMLLETAKTEARATSSTIAIDPLDAMNLEALRGLLRR